MTVEVEPTLAQPGGLAHDAARGRVLISPSLTQSITQLDLATGDRSVLVASDAGAGPRFAGVSEFDAFDPGGRMLVQDLFLNALVLLDVESGDRVILLQ